MVRRRVWPTTHAVYSSSLFLESAHYPDPISDPDNTGVITERRKFRTFLAYLQWTQRTGDRFRYAAQVQLQDVRTTFDRSLEELTGTTLSAIGDLTTSPPARYFGCVASIKACAAFRST